MAGLNYPKKNLSSSNQTRVKQTVSTGDGEDFSIDAKIETRTNPNSILTINMLVKESNGTVYGFNCAKRKLQKVTFKKYLNIYIHDGLEFLVKKN
jgi:hypothetical protein